MLLRVCFISPISGVLPTSARSAFSFFYLLRTGVFKPRVEHMHDDVERFFFFCPRGALPVRTVLESPDFLIRGCVSTTRLVATLMPPIRRRVDYLDCIGIRSVDLQ